jgi:ferredoxin-NADP reductase
VVEVRRETADAVTLLLADPSGAAIHFEAGQFLTLLVPLPGPAGASSPPLRRAYSACSSPLDGSTIAITSKRVAGGRVSNYLNDLAAPGMLLSTLGPSGHFTPRPHPQQQRQLVLIGGGSGITPLLSILQTVLAVERSSQVVLFYGNRRRQDIIFYDRLEELARSEPERLWVRHVLSEPPPDLDCGHGLLDEAVLTAELDRLPAAGSLRREFYLCGPAPMLAAAQAVLHRRSVPKGTIYEERFASLRPASETASPLPQPLRLRLGDGPPQTLTVGPNQTLLEAGLKGGAAMPFSCTLGGCGACKGRLTEGEVTMEEPNCLSESERAAGYILCCIARPRSPVAVELAAPPSGR